MKKLMILAAMLAAMLVAAAPALGQQGQQQEGPYYAEEETITGVVGTKTLPNITQPVYVIADEENGVDRIIETLGPDEGGPILSRYVGQRVTITGIPQTLGNPPSNFDNFLTDVPVLVTSIEPADGQETPSAGTVELTFEVSVDGEVAEGRTLGLSLPGTADIGGAFCSTASGSDLPTCEDGGTYTATFSSIGNATSSTFPTGAGEPRSYEYTVSSNEGLLEVFAADTITPTEDTTVSATYHPGGSGGSQQDQYDNNGGGKQPDDEQYTDNGDASDGNTGGETTTSGETTGAGNSGDGSSATEDDNELSGGVLPDTGGLPLVGLGAGAVLVVGGLVLRRLYR